MAQVLNVVLNVLGVRQGSLRSQAPLLVQTLLAWDAVDLQRWPSACKHRHRLFPATRNQGSEGRESVCTVACGPSWDRRAQRFVSVWADRILPTESSCRGHQDYLLSSIALLDCINFPDNRFGIQRFQRDMFFQELFNKVYKYSFAFYLVNSNRGRANVRNENMHRIKWFIRYNGGLFNL